MVRVSAVSAAVLFLLGLLTASFQAQQSQPGGRGAGGTGRAEQAAPGGRAQSIDDRTGGMQRFDGYFPLYWDERAGTLYLEIPRFDADFLLSTGLAAGLGSNDIGLDRGQGGQGRVVKFERIGPKILLTQGNQSFRSSSVNAAERKSVDDSFAKSVLWGFTVAAESNGRVLVDATDFLLRDVMGAGNALRPGNYRVDRTRSVFYMPRTRAFAKNTEIETTLTFVNEAAGGRAGGGGGRGGGLFSGSVASVTPAADAVTMREHVSLVELPDTAYKTREDDPRGGYGGLTFVDYSTPIGEPMQMRYIRRHRLEKKDPNAAIGEPGRASVYYVLNRVPRKTKKALIEGA